jgi:hypothetical protein
MQQPCPCWLLLAAVAGCELLLAAAASCWLLLVAAAAGCCCARARSPGGIFEEFLRIFNFFLKNKKGRKFLATRFLES